MELPELVVSFLDRLEHHDGYQPLSDAKVASLSRADRYVSVEEDGDIVAVGAVAQHFQESGESHWSAETAVDPTMRFAEFEDVVLASTLTLAPEDSVVTVWSRRPSLDSALERTDFFASRSLVNMQIPLPVEAPGPMAVDGMVEGEEDSLIAINASAFAPHPEAGSLDRAELAELMDESWFDRDGVRLHRGDSGVDAFCWTKVHQDGVGEIYRIGVAPSARGQGLGRQMALEGFRYLTEERGCTIGALWVDEANEPAMRLYESLGMKVVARNSEFTKRGGHTDHNS